MSSFQAQETIIPFCILATLKEITGHMTINDTGIVKADGEPIFTKTSSWMTTANFSMPGNARIVVIEAHNPYQIGAILASFGNGIIIDESWECIDADYRSHALWPAAISYGKNDGTVSSWGTRSPDSMKDISVDAQWIWTESCSEEAVVCKKVFGKYVLFPSLL